MPSEETTTIPDVVLAMATPSDILKSYYPNGQVGGITVDGRTDWPLGQRVNIEVRVATPAIRFHLEGHLAWVRHSMGTLLHPCYGIDFVDADASIRLMRFAYGELSGEAARRDDRVVADFNVRLTTDGYTRTERLVDLSVGGAFIQTDDPPFPGETVKIRFRIPGTLRWITLEGGVAWIRKSGTAPGMGIRFTSPEAHRPRVEKILQRLGAQRIGTPAADAASSTDGAVRSPR